jgi:hypothetical protein
MLTVQKKFSILSILRFLGLLTFIFTICIFFLLKNSLVESRILSIFGILDGQSVSSLNTRLLLWQDRLDLIYQNPLGFGLGSAGWNLHHSMGIGSDSNFLKFFLELGWVGGAISIFILLIFLVKYAQIIKFKKNSKTSYQFIIVQASLCFYIAIIALMVTTQVLEAYPINLFFWFFLGIVASISTSLKRSY